MIENINPEALNSMDADSLVKHYDDLNNAWHKWMETGDLPSGMDLTSLAKIYWQVVDALKQKGYDLVAPPESDAELVPPKVIQTNENVEQSMNVAATQKYAPFYESEIQEAGEHPLRVPDPDFIMSRLRQGKEALLLSKEDQGPLNKRMFILMNQYPSEDTPVKGYGRVSFDQQKLLIHSVNDLGDRVESLDPLTKEEFSRLKGPFYVETLTLNDDFGEPKEYPTPPQGRPTSGISVMPMAEAIWNDGTQLVEAGIDPHELEMGTKHEMEHTDDPEIAKKYATDHLEKFSDYYTVLAKAEKMMKPADNQPRSELNNTEKQFEGGPGTEDGGQQVRDMNAFTTKGHAGVFQPHEAAGGDPLQSL